MQGYTTAELQRETGFDRRTIAYYVHEGLLPKVGRRGSRTRYPKLVRDRLLFVRAVRGGGAAGDGGTRVPPRPARDLPAGAAGTDFPGRGRADLRDSGSRRWDIAQLPPARPAAGSHRGSMGARAGGPNQGWVASETGRFKLP